MDTNCSIVLREQIRHDRAHSQRVCLRGTSIVTQVPGLARPGTSVTNLSLLTHGYQVLPHTICTGVRPGIGYHNLDAYVLGVSSADVLGSIWRVF